MSIELVITGEPMEEWVDIEGYEGMYQVSNKGNVKSLKREIRHKTGLITTIKGGILKPCKDGKGYLMIRLSRNKKIKMKKIHRLVAEHFIPEKDKNKQVNHKDGNKENNRAENLEWCTCKENIQHAFENNLMLSGEKSPFAKLTEEQVIEIRKTYIKGDEVFGGKPLAREYGVSSTTIRAIVQGKKWRHIDG